MTHYDTLNISATANQDEVKKAYRVLANKHHPDKHWPDEDGVNKRIFQRIQEAYDVLGDQDKRHHYDNALRQPNQFNTAENIRKFWEAQRNNGHRGKPGDVKIQMHVTLQSTLTSWVKDITIGNNNTIKIKIPAGIRDGMVIHYEKVVEWPNVKGDLFVTFIVTPDPKFQASDSDLVNILHITCIEAMLGCEKEITCLGGERYKIKVHEGTQPGVKLSIPNQGLVTTLSGSSRGRLIIILDISIPNNLTQSQKEILQTLNLTT